MTTKLAILKSLHLGSSVAEEEKNELEQYFIRTGAWERLFNGEVDVIYGGKGAGKSALYLLLVDQQDALAKKGISIIPGENTTEDPVFKILDERDDLSEKEFMGLWKLYILSLLGNHIRQAFPDDRDFLPILKRLQEAGLIPADGLRAVLKVAMRYLSAIKPGMEIGGVKYTISIDETTLEDEAAGVISAQVLLNQMNSLLVSKQRKVWILLDRLDVAFTKPPSETPALRALFRVYRDMAGLENVRMKIFIRSDIWERITRNQGFREQSHITKTLTIDWKPEALRHVVLARFFSNRSFEEATGLKKEDALSRGDLQDAAANYIFPPQVETGAKKSGTFDWILKRVQDGKQNIAPREVIHLVTNAQEEQIKLEERGGAGSDTSSLLSPNALKLALDKVSQRKVETYYSEYPALRLYIEAFKGAKTEHNLQSLQELFARRGLSADQNIFREMLDVGFLQERTSGGGTTYWVPFIFRPFLDMSQGAAFEREKTIDADD